MSNPVAVADTPAAPAGTNPWVIAPVVALAAFMEVLDTSIANVSLRHIAGTLSAAVDESTWVLTSYTVTNVMIVPVSAWLSVVLGRKNYFLLSIVGFSIASLFCGVAPTLGLLVAFRAVQGLTGGGLQPVSQAILMDAFPPAKRGMAMAVYALAVVFAPAIGPTLGGWITDNFDWRWVFLINLPVGIAVAMLVQLLVHDPEHLVQENAQRRRAGIKLDYIGLSLLVSGAGFLQIVMDRGQQADWFSSDSIIVMTIVAVLSIAAFIIWELTSDDPIVDLGMFRYRNFTIGGILMFVLGAVVLSSITMVPLFVQEVLNYTATQAGMVMTAGGCIMVVAMPLTGALVSKIDGRWIMAVGFVVFGISILYLTNFDLTTTFGRLSWSWIAVQSALGMIFIPINVLAYTKVPPNKTGDVSGLLNMFRNLGAGVGISLATTELARRAQFHQEFLSAQTSNLNPSYHDVLQGTSQALTAVSSGVGEAVQRASAVIYDQILLQANLMAFLDNFWVLGFLAMAMLPLPFLMKKGDAHDLAAAGMH